MRQPATPGIEARFKRPLHRFAVPLPVPGRILAGLNNRRLQRVHVFVAQPEMMADLMHHDMRDKVIE